MTHDYKRHGTTTLFAALGVLDGTVIGRCMQRHRRDKFIRFLNTVEREVIANRPIHVVLDNYATHKHPKSFLASASSALDFSLHPDLGLLAQCGREFLFQDDATAYPPRRLPLDHQPAATIKAYLAEHNASPKPFVWTKSPEVILAKLDRCPVLSV